MKTIRSARPKNVKTPLGLMLAFGLAFVSIGVDGQTAGTAKVNSQLMKSIAFDAENYDLSFPITPSDSKNAYMAKAKNFQYGIELSLKDAGSCKSDALTNWQDTYAANSLSGLAKDGTPFVTSLKGKDVNGSIERELERCGWPTTSFSAVLSLIVFDKTGKMMVVSTIELEVPSKSSSLESASDEIIKLFRQGLAAKKINDQQLESTIEKYMEKKWSSEDITTIHVTDLQYQNVAKTTFKLDGYYITRESNNTCKYNSFYADGNKGVRGYAITFFNSTDSETSIDCGVADRLTNR